MFSVVLYSIVLYTAPLQSTEQGLVLRASVYAMPVVPACVHCLEPQTAVQNLRASFSGTISGNFQGMITCAGVSLGNNGGNSIVRGCSCLRIGDAQAVAALQGDYWGMVACSRV
jgi:hypothetical protein